LNIGQPGRNRNNGRRPQTKPEAGDSERKDEFVTRVTLSAKGLVLRIVGDILIIETTDPDELRRHVNSALGDNLLSVRDAANYVGVTTRTIKNWISNGTLEAKKYGSAFRIRKQDLERISDPQESRN
jgi:excisionase family DNA binding protein